MWRALFPKRPGFLSQCWWRAAKGAAQPEHLCIWLCVSEKCNLLSPGYLGWLIMVANITIPDWCRRPGSIPFQRETASISAMCSRDTQTTKSDQWDLHSYPTPRPQQLTYRLESEPRSVFAEALLCWIWSHEDKTAAAGLTPQVPSAGGFLSHWSSSTQFQN